MLRQRRSKRAGEMIAPFAPIEAFLQKAMGYSTVQAGLAFLPLTVTFIASNIASGWMAGRVGSRLIGAVGYGLLSRLGAGQH